MYLRVKPAVAIWLANWWAHRTYVNLCGERKNVRVSGRVAVKYSFVFSTLRMHLAQEPMSSPVPVISPCILLRSDLGVTRYTVEDLTGYWGVDCIWDQLDWTRAIPFRDSTHGACSSSSFNSLVNSFSISLMRYAPTIGVYSTVDHLKISLFDRRRA